MIKKLSSYTFALLGLILLFSACKKEYESIQNTDDAKLQQYISSNHLQVTKDSTGFYYQTITPGIGYNFTDKDSVLYNVIGYQWNRVLQHGCLFCKLRNAGWLYWYFRNAVYSGNSYSNFGYKAGRYNNCVVAFLPCIW
jgi:archaellum component FlaF (FlaF/FlaG flagellin family)